VENSLVVVENEICVSIAADQDVVAARQKGRAMALKLGFSAGDSTLLATAISELARNIVSYAGQGEIVLQATQNSGCPGVWASLCTPRVSPLRLPLGQALL